ncbi:hypothetical protein ACFSSB_06870 [Lacinutrix gracilariae]|uniref:SGNH/GDSL hydrolase family protein n=1 Tax=Lacinutrix gracilariae TaxID=1747198 RepID=A0ABW5K1A7_9FLAO
MNNGHVDAFYSRFTTPKQSSLVLGTSRAAQGIVPEVLNEELGRDDIFNYSFTVAHSSYGPVYLESIKKKIVKNSNDCVYIVTVDPWSISADKEDQNNILKFIENGKCVETIWFVNSKPNVQYLLFNYNESYINLFNKNKKMFLHDDGWLEVNVKKMDSVRINERVKFYKEEIMPNNTFSKVRFEYLLKTIQFLKKHGKVYLIRLPIHPKLMEVEMQYMANFNGYINEAINLSNDYFDMTKFNNEFDYTDGNHLYKESSKKVSKLIVNRINNNK